MSSSYHISTVTSISVQELAQRLSDPESKPQLIDVREPQELAIVAIAGFESLPLSQSETWAPKITDRFDPQQETIVICHHGVRSAQMCHWLTHQGFSQVKNVTGGIDAYALYIDATLPRY